MKKNSLKDELLSLKIRLRSGVEDVRSEIRQYLLGLPEERSVFFAATVAKKEFVSSYYPFAATLERRIGTLEEITRELGALLERSEQQMDIEVLTHGGQLFDRYWAFKAEINACLREIEATLRRHPDALPLPELRACALRISYQAESLSDLLESK